MGRGSNLLYQPLVNPTRSKEADLPGIGLKFRGMISDAATDYKQRMISSDIVTKDKLVLGNNNGYQWAAKIKPSLMSSWVVETKYLNAQTFEQKEALVNLNNPPRAKYLIPVMVKPGEIRSATLPDVPPINIQLDTFPMYIVEQAVGNKTGSWRYCLVEKTLFYFSNRKRLVGFVQGVE